MFTQLTVGASWILALGALSGCWGGGGVDQPVSSSPGKGAAVHGGLNNIADRRSAPEFELPSVDGKLHRLSELKGNAVLVHFWASWCPPCLGEIPHWIEFAERWKGRPVRFVAISLDKGWADALKILPTERLPVQMLSLLDSSLKWPDAYGTYQYPETYLLTPDLKIASKWVGSQEWGHPRIAAAIEEVLR